MSLTKEIARLREEHWLAMNALLGKKAHDYEDRNLAIEAIKECADAHNYLRHSDGGYRDLADEAAALGDSIARRGGLIG